MLYQTPPDRFDAHVHTVELDDSGDGLTSEDGAVPHAHEVQGGVVLEARMQNYVSDHPGDLIPAQSPDEQMPQNPNGMQQGQSSPMGAPAPMQQGMGPGGPGMGESLLLYMERQILEGTDPLQVAERFLFS